MAVDIAKLVEAARESNFVGFCTAVHIKRCGPNHWDVTLIQRDDAPSGQPIHGSGATPEIALENARARVRKWIENKYTAASEEAGKAKELLTALS